MAFSLVCETQVTYDLDSNPVCTTGWLSQPYAEPFSISSIDPSVATAMFGAGFVIFVVPWAAAWGVTQMLKLLK